MQSNDSFSAIRPKAKVMAGGIGGALSAVAIWVLRVYGGLELPPDVAAALATIFAFAVAYLVPDHPDD